MRKFLRIYSLLFLTSCVSFDREPDEPVKICILRPAEATCYIDQKSGAQKSLKAVDGWFAISPEDMVKILDRLEDGR